MLLEADRRNLKSHKGIGSHFILSGLNYYVLTSKNKYNVLNVFILYCNFFADIEVEFGSG